MNCIQKILGFTMLVVVVAMIAFAMGEMAPRLLASIGWHDLASMGWVIAPL